MTDSKDTVPVGPGNTAGPRNNDSAAVMGGDEGADDDDDDADDEWAQEGVQLDRFGRVAATSALNLSVCPFHRADERQNPFT